MRKQIKIKGQEINYEIRKSRRAKRLSLAIYANGEVVAIKPNNISVRIIELFIAQKADLIISKLNFFAGLKNIIPKSSKSDYFLNKEKAFHLVNSKITKLNKIYNFKYNKISIKNQKTRWGSCSQKGNLNFNYRMIYLSDKIVEYIIVHELCHLQEFNHSSRFWNLVAVAVPDYKEIKKELKNKGLSYF